MHTSLAKKIFAVGSSVAMLLGALVPAFATAAVHSDGTNVVSSGTVYFISQGTKRPYTSAGAFLSYGFNSWSNVVAASAEDLALPTGAYVPPADGSLINDKGTVYLITNGQRAGFTSAANFLGLGYAWSNVIPGDTSFMPSAALVNSTAIAHPVGTLVNQSGTVYLMTTAGKMGIPSLSVFNSWGYSFKNVVPANSYDNAIAMNSGIMPAWAMGQLSPAVNGGGTVPVPTGNGVSVSVDSMTPAAGSVAKGAKVTFSRLDFTAGSQPAVVNSLVVTRIGLSADSDVSNVYLYDHATNTQLAVGSFNNGRVTFTGAPLFTVPAGSTKVVSVRADMSSTGTTGDSIGYGVASAADVNGAVASGNFPVNGNLMTIAAVSNLGALTITSPASSLPSTVNPGTLASNIGYFQLAGSNQPLSVTYLKLTNIGSVAQSDIQNIKLFNGTTQVGSTVQQNTDKTVVFDLSGSPLLIPSGNTVTLWVKGDIMGGSNRNYQFTIQRTSDVMVTDTTYNTGIVPGLATATGTSPIPSGTNNQVTINAGTATLQVATDSPTGNIAVGATGVTLGKFAFTATGEDIRVSSITVTAAQSVAESVTNGDTSDYLKNGKLLDVTGGGSVQVGSTANLNYDTKTTTSRTTVFSIPGYWTIPAGTTRTLAVVADTQAGLATNAQLVANGGATVSVALGTIVAQGVNSLSAALASSTATGRVLTIVSGSLTAAKNVAFANPTVVTGQTNVRLGSWTLTAGSAEAININQFTVTAKTGSAAAFQNIRLMNGSTQVGATQGALVDGTDYTFAPNSTVVVPAGSSIVVDLYGDVLAGLSGSTVSTAFNLKSVSATGATTNTTATIVAKDGQDVTISTGGSMTVSLDSQSPTAAQLQQLVMGSAQQTVGVFNLAAGQGENVNINRIKFTDTETTGKQGDMQNFKLYVNGSQVGPVVAAEGGSLTTGTVEFNMQSTPIVVPQNGNVSVYLKADISDYLNATSGDSHQFGIAVAGDIDSVGAISGGTIAESGLGSAVNASAGIVYRSSVTLAKDATSPSGVSAASATQTVAVFNVSNAANAANQQATFLPSCTQAGDNSVLVLNLSSTIVPTAAATRVLKIFKSTDLTTAVAAVTLNVGATPGSGTWSGTVTFGCGASYNTAVGTPAGAGVQGATFVANAASWTTEDVSSVSWTPQTINAGTTTQYVVQFDTSEAAAQKSFTLTVPSSQGKVWYDGSAAVSTLMGAPVTFGTLTY